MTRVLAGQRGIKTLADFAYPVENLNDLPSWVSGVPFPTSANFSIDPSKPPAIIKGLQAICEYNPTKVIGTHLIGSENHLTRPHTPPPVFQICRRLPLKTNPDSNLYFPQGTNYSSVTASYSSQRLLYYTQRLDLWKSLFPSWPTTQQVLWGVPAQFEFAITDGAEWANFFGDNGFGSIQSPGQPPFAPGLDPSNYIKKGASPSNMTGAPNLFGGSVSRHLYRDPAVHRGIAVRVGELHPVDGVLTGYDVNDPAPYDNLYVWLYGTKNGAIVKTNPVPLTVPLALEGAVAFTCVVDVAAHTMKIYGGRDSSSDLNLAAAQVLWATFDLTLFDNVYSGPISIMAGTDFYGTPFPWSLSSATIATPPGASYPWNPPRQQYANPDANTSTYPLLDGAQWFKAPSALSAKLAAMGMPYHQSYVNATQQAFQYVNNPLSPRTRALRLSYCYDDNLLDTLHFHEYPTYIRRKVTYPASGRAAIAIGLNGGGPYAPVTRMAFPGGTNASGPSQPLAHPLSYAPITGTVTERTFYTRTLDTVAAMGALRPLVFDLEFGIQTAAMGYGLRVSCGSSRSHTAYSGAGNGAGEDRTPGQSHLFNMFKIEVFTGYNQPPILSYAIDYVAFGGTLPDTTTLSEGVIIVLDTTAKKVEIWFDRVMIYRTPAIANVFDNIVAVWSGQTNEVRVGQPDNIAGEWWSGAPAGLVRVETLYYNPEYKAIVEQVLSNPPPPKLLQMGGESPEPYWLPANTSSLGVTYGND